MVQAAPQMLLDELEGLVKLAEESSAEVDRIKNAVDKIRTNGIVSIGSIYLVVSGLSYLSLQLTNSVPPKSDPVLSVVGVAVGVLVGAAFLYLFANKMARYKALKQSLKVEREIHDRLVVMVDEQMRRIKNEFGVSPVILATLEMRIRRLDRSERGA